MSLSLIKVKLNYRRRARKKKKSLYYNQHWSHIIVSDRSIYVLTMPVWAFVQYCLKRM